MPKLLLIGIGTVLLLAAGAWFWFVAPQTAEPQSEQEAPVALAPRAVPAGYKEYSSAEYRFSLLYIESMAVAEFAEEGGGVTITFEDTNDKNNLKGFQLFVAPHAGGEVNEAFVAQHMPGASQFEPVVVDGAAGVAFVTSDGALGQVREVWFARGSYLYQTATPQPLEALLHEALQSWKFF